MNLIKFKSYNKITHRRQINLCSRIYCKNFLFNIMYNKISATLSNGHVLGNNTILKQSDNDLKKSSKNCIYTAIFSSLYNFAGIVITYPDLLSTKLCRRDLSTRLIMKQLCIKENDICSQFVKFTFRGYIWISDRFSNPSYDSISSMYKQRNKY